MDSKRIFKYNDQVYEDPGQEFSIDDVRQHLTQFFPELANATHSKRTLEDGTVEIVFAKKVGVKGLLLDDSRTVQDLMLISGQVYRTILYDEGDVQDGVYSGIWEQFVEQGQGSPLRQRAMLIHLAAAAIKATLNLDNEVRFGFNPAQAREETVAALEEMLDGRSGRD